MKKQLGHGLSDPRATRLLRRLQTPPLGYLAALGAVAIVTALIGLVIGRVPMANISMLYLIAVLATAVAFGSGPAVLASFAAFLAFDWFFVEPVYTITVANPDEWTSLIVFLLTAIVTGQLAAGQRREARDAREREREAVVLYDVVRLMEDPNLDRAHQAVANRLRDELDLAAVAIQLPGDGGPATVVSAGDERGLEIVQSRGQIASSRLDGGEAPTDHCRGRPGTWRNIRPFDGPTTDEGPRSGRLYEVPITTPGGKRGTLFLVRTRGDESFRSVDDRLLSAVAAQLGIALDREDLRREATEAEILRRTDELRRALLNAVSHDLRTPLASIIAAGGSLSEDDVTWSPDEVRGFGRDIESEALRLNRIVSNLLDLSRIQAGALVPQKAWYDLGALVEEVLGRLRLDQRGRRVVLRVEGELPPVHLDYVEIDQVLTNLIENAVKYTPPFQPIEIGVRRVDGQVEVEVKDRGPGIAPAALPRVFEPFYRAADHRRCQGTGLGLAVARGLVEAHGGRIWVENAPEGGARFVFTVPLIDTKTPSADKVYR